MRVIKNVDSCRTTITAIVAKATYSTSVITIYLDRGFINTIQIRNGG
jgi:hypothetical protein